MINESFARDSNLFIALALVAYAIAFFAYCGEWAFGSRSRLGARVGAIGRGERSATPPLAGEAGTVRTIGSSGVSLLLRTAPERQEPTVAGGSLRAEVLGRFAVMATVIGFALHAVGVLFRGLAAHRVPWANMYEFSCAASLTMALAYLSLLATGRKARWLGLPVTFIVLITLGIAYTLLYTDVEELVPALNSYWLYIHVTAAALSTGSFGVATTATAAYVLKLATEEGKLPRLSRGLSRLPSSLALDRVAYRVIAFTFPLWTFAVMAGAIWAEKAWGRYWGWDPKETWSFIVWVVYAAYLHARATHGWKGKAAAYIALAAFACVLTNYFIVNTLLTGKHSYAGL